MFVKLQRFKYIFPILILLLSSITAKTIKLNFKCQSDSDCFEVCDKNFEDCQSLVCINEKCKYPNDQQDSEIVIVLPPGSVPFTPPTPPTDPTCNSTNCVSPNECSSGVCTCSPTLCVSPKQCINGSCVTPPPPPPPPSCVGVVCPSIMIGSILNFQTTFCNVNLFGDAGCHTLNCTTIAKCATQLQCPPIKPICTFRCSSSSSIFPTFGICNVQL